MMAKWSARLKKTLRTAHSVLEEFGSKYDGSPSIQGPVALHHFPWGAGALYSHALCSTPTGPCMIHG
jgi:hypothetical protein